MMFDEVKTTVPKHPNRIDIADNEEMRYWMEKFRCSRGQLVMAIAKVGYTTAAVEHELKQRV